MTFRADAYRLQVRIDIYTVVRLFFGTNNFKEALTSACLFGSFNIAHLKLLASHAEVGRHRTGGRTEKWGRHLTPLRWALIICNR